LRKTFPDLCISRVDWFSLVTYPLSSGFKDLSLISLSMARRVLGFERIVERLVDRYSAFRMMLVVENGPS